MFSFVCNHGWNWNKIISAVERVVKLLQDYFGDIEHVGNYSWAEVIIWNNFEIIWSKFPRAEIKLFQTHVDDGWYSFTIILLPECYVTFRLCYRKSVCLYVCLYVCRLSVLNVYAPYLQGWSFRQYFFTAVYLSHLWPPRKILRRSSQENPSVGGIKRKRGSKTQRWWTYRRFYFINCTRYGLGYN